MAYSIIDLPAYRQPDENDETEAYIHAVNRYPFLVLDVKAVDEGRINPEECPGLYARVYGNYNPEDNWRYPHALLDTEEPEGVLGASARLMKHIIRGHLKEQN